MRRPSSPLLVGFFLALSLTIPLSAADRLNVVFFLVDDLGYMDVGANNPETFYETPNIDRLAASGMRFTDGYAANPVCSPTRYSIMTGQYPTRVGATNWFSGTREGTLQARAPPRPTCPSRRSRWPRPCGTPGYRTFFAGKWHLGPTEEYWPEDQGFDVNRGGLEPGRAVRAGEVLLAVRQPASRGRPGGRAPARPPGHRGAGSSSRRTGPSRSSPTSPSTRSTRR